MTDKLRRQIGIGKAFHFEWKNHPEAIERARHLKATLRFPCPDLWAYVIANADIATAFFAQATFE